MKWIEVKADDEMLDFTDNFLNEFLDDIKAVFKERRLSLRKEFLTTLIMKSNKVMASARDLCKKDSDIASIRIELTILKNFNKPLVKFSFIPLNGDKEPLLENNKAPAIIFPIEPSLN